MAAVTTLLTEADCMAIEEVEGGPRYELDEGELVEMPPQSFRHNLTRGDAAFEFVKYLESSPVAST
jgi:Uma2 family endonuclease